MLGLVLSFREYYRDKFLLYSTAVYEVCAGNALLPSYVSQVLGSFFLRNRRGYFCLQIFFFFSSCSILPYWSEDSLFSVFHMQGVTGSELARASWWIIHNLCGFIVCPEITWAFRLKSHPPKPLILFSKSKEAIKPNRRETTQQILSDTPVPLQSQMGASINNC